MLYRDEIMKVWKLAKDLYNILQWIRPSYCGVSAILQHALASYYICRNIDYFFMFIISRPTSYFQAYLEEYIYYVRYVGESASGCLKL